MAHKGPADDGKRFYSDGRCMGQPEALLFNMGGSLRGGMARGRTGYLAGGFFPNSCFTCMGAHFWTIMAPNFQTPFSVGPRVTFDSLLGGPGVAFGCLVGTSWILWGVLGVLVRFFWVPLARLGRL